MTVSLTWDSLYKKISDEESKEEESSGSKWKVSSHLYTDLNNLLLGG